MFLKSKEDKRQIVHLVLGILIAFFAWFFQELVAIPLFFGIIGLIILSHYPEFSVSKFLNNHFEEHRKTKMFQGAIFYGIGILPVILLIPFITREVGCAIITILSAGDSFSTLIGKRFGKHSMGNKSVEGFLAFLVSGFIFSYIFLSSVFWAFMLSFFGATLELLSPKHLDDNILIPWGLLIIFLSIAIVGLFWYD